VPGSFQVVFRELDPILRIFAHTNIITYDRNDSLDLKAGRIRPEVPRNSELRGTSTCGPGRIQTCDQTVMGSISDGVYFAI
jgi:hypothetical protein